MLVHTLLSHLKPCFDINRSRVHRPKAASEHGLFVVSEKIGEPLDHELFSEMLCLVGNVNHAHRKLLELIHLDEPLLLGEAQDLHHLLEPSSSLKKI